MIAGGRLVHRRLGRRTRGHRRHHRARQRGGVFVRDTGPGLTPELQEHLFESFYTTKTKGLGLGLVIVRSIVERHNGRVYAETAAGRGAVFRVLLPVPPVSSIR